MTPGVRGKSGAAAKKAQPTAKSTKGGKGAKKAVQGWEDDPGAPRSPATPVQRPVPELGGRPLAFNIAGPAPTPKRYTPGTAEFRYWVAADALGRSGDLWSLLCPGLSWFSTVGPSLTVELDFGAALNAYYDRQHLRFFRGAAAGKLVFSGESPDVVCHEVGHAILDALRPQLWDVAFIEAAALHESFGDVGSMLCALQLRSVRESVLVETDGRLQRSSRITRLAEQLGWAIGTVKPGRAEPDCLRNAANPFFYSPPESLPPAGPAATLSSEPHSFSRVFTASFLDALAGMFQLQADPDEAALLQVSQDAGLLLVDAVVDSPVVPSYYSQIAAHMIEADAVRFEGRHIPALEAAFVQRGVLSLDSANTLARRQAGERRGVRPPTPAASESGTAPMVALPGGRYGLDEDLLVHAPAETKRFSVAGSAPDVGPVDPPAHDRAAQSFVEDLFRRGKVDVGSVAPAGTAVAPGTALASHELRREEQGLVLVRRLIDCR